MTDTNYGFISQRPLAGDSNNLLQLNLLPGSQEVAQQLIREQEWSDLEACVLMNRDEESAKQAREAYGKPLPLSGDPSSDYLFGSKIVRTLGIERCPEQYFIQQGLPVPRTKGRKELYPYIAKHFREDVNKRYDARLQEQEQANMAAEFFESRVNMPKYGTEDGYAELVMEVARRMPENRRGGWLEQAEEFWQENKDILHANVRQAELEKKHGTIKEAKWSAWARPQLLDWARDLAAIRKENPKAYEVILGRMVEEAKKNTGNAAENVGAGLPVQAIVNLLDEAAKMEKAATDVNLFMNATGTPSVGMPGMHLSTTGYTPEQRKAREVPAWYESVSKEDMAEMNTLITMIRGMRGGHGEGAWDISFAPVNGWLKRNVGFDLGTDSTRDLLASAAASTSWYALTRGAGTLLSTSGEKGYELLANGSSHDSAIVRGFGEGAVQTAAEGIFGIGGRFTPLRSVAGRAVSKVAHMHPVTRKSISSLLVGGNKVARYGRGWSAAARNKMWRSALARFGADTLVGAGEEMAEELFGIWAGSYLDTALAKRAGETNTESFNKATGEYEPFKAALRQTGELVTNGAAWLSFLGMGAGFSGLRLPAYRYDRKIATASAPELVAMGVSPTEAPRIASIADPEKRRDEALRAGALGRVANKKEIEEARRFVAGDMSAFEDYALYDVLSKTGVLPDVKPALKPDGSRKTDAQGRELWTYSDTRGSIDMTEDAASEAMAGAMLKLNGWQQAVLANAVVARAMINKLTDTEGVITERVGQRMDMDYFMALADAAKVRIAEGASPDSIDPDIDPGMELGQVAALGAAWQNRLDILRHDEEQRLGRPLTEDEFANIRKKADSPINRQFSRKRKETLFRFIRGEIGVEKVLEDVVEDSIDADMRRTKRSEKFYVDSIKQLEKELGKEGQFLEDKDSYTKQDIIEALGKIVEAKVLADTAKKDNGLSDWVNDFLALIRKWMSEVIAFVKLGSVINKVLTDEKARERLGDEFVSLVESLAHQNTEFMRGLQREATLRYTLDAATRKPSPTPTLTAAMEEHGEAVTAETEERERQHKALSDDIREAVEPELSASTEHLDEIKALQAEEDALEFLRKGEFEYADLRTENRADVPQVPSGNAQEGHRDGGADARAGEEVQHEQPVLGDGLQAEESARPRRRLRDGRALRAVTARVHRFHGGTKGSAAQLGFYAGHIYELRQDDAVAAQAFADCINAAKASRGVLGDCVYTYEVEEYRQMRLFLTPDGKAGIALKSNGDMVSVFTHREQKNTLGGRCADSLIELAINEGAVKADCYGYFLARLYGRHGFRAIAKDAFNAEFATEAMQNRETMLANFPRESGKPDVVYLTYMGNRETALDDFNDDYKPTYQNRLDYSDYDTCCATQDAGVKECRKIEALPAEVKQPVLDATNDVDLRHFGLTELARVKSERNRKRAVDMVHAASILQSHGVDVFTEAGRQEAENMAEYAARCREQLAARAVREKDSDMQARVLATAARWERWTELDDLKGEAARWDGKARVTPRLVDAPADDAGFSSSVFTPSERQGLDALLSVASNGALVKFHSDALGVDAELGKGSAGKLSDTGRIYGANGLMHIICTRMAHGYSLDDAAYTAAKAILAAVNGKVNPESSTENKKELELDGVSVWVYMKFKEDFMPWIVTGYKQDKKKTDAVVRRRAMNLGEDYAVNQFGGFDELGAALRRAIARLEDERKQKNPTDANITHSVSVAREVGIMQDGKLEAANGTLYDMSGASFSILARHASPHSGIRKFLIEFIGTGEGAQAYGHGLYFSTNYTIHEHYVNSFSRPEYVVSRGYWKNGKEIEPHEPIYPYIHSNVQRSSEAATAWLPRTLKWERKRLEDFVRKGRERNRGEAWEARYRSQSETLAKAEEQIADFGHIEVEVIPSVPASEYEVLLNIDRNGENLLRWDEEIPEETARALGMILPRDFVETDAGFKNWVEEYFKRPIKHAEMALLQYFRWAEYNNEAVYKDLLGKIYWATATGADVYKELCRKHGSKRGASEALLAVGIKGIEYRDGSSRRSDEDVTYNYVMFDEADIKVVRVKDHETGYEWQDYEDADATFSMRTSPPPKKTGIGYKVFYQKDGKLYPPMVANPGGQDTPVGVWLDADEGTRAPDSKMGRPQVKAGGKGTQGGSGTLSYRPGWHLGEIPYALQFNRVNPATGKKELFPASFVWAEVEYAMDEDYQEEAMSYGYTENGKFRHSYAGLPRLPKNGFYRYRTNPNPATDPWIITGAMKVNRVLSPLEVDELVRAVGREPQRREEEAEVSFSTSLSPGGFYRVNDDNVGLTGVVEQKIVPVYVKFEPRIQGTKDWLKELRTFIRENLAGKTFAIGNTGKKIQVKSSSKRIARAVKGVRSQKKTEAGKRLEEVFAKAVKLAEMLPEHKPGEGRERTALVNATDRYEVFGCPVSFNGEEAGILWFGAYHDKEESDDLLDFYEFGLAERLGQKERQRLKEEQKKAGEPTVVQTAEQEAGVQRTEGSPDAVTLGEVLVNVNDKIKGMPTIEEAAPHSDFSSAIRFLDSATTGHGGLTEERMAFAQTIAENVSKMLTEEIARFRSFDGKAHGSREKALVAIGAVYNMARSVAMLMPEGYRVNVRPWLNQLQVFAELAASGKLDLTADMASQDVRGMYEAHGNADGESNPMVEWHSKLVQEHGNEKVNEVLAKILSKVGEKLTKMERDAAVESIKNLLRRLEPQRDPKTGKLKRGIMSAEGYDEVAKAAEAMQMSAEELDTKLTELEASISKAQSEGNEDEALRLQGLHTLYSTYGDLKSMSLAQVVAAYENLQELVKWNRWAWDEALAGRRFEQLRVVDETVRGLGGMPSLNAEHSARMEKPIGKRLRRVGDVLKSFPQVLATLDKVGAGALADSLRTRLNAGMEGIKTAERERWVKIEAVSRKTLGKSWRKCMNMLHEVQQTGIPFDQPLHRSVTLSRAYAQELVEMTPEQRKAEWKKNEAMGGSMALARYSEEAVAAMEEELAKGGRSKDITVRFVEDVRHVDNLELSKGQAMYALLMYEQPTYTEQMQAQGYTEEFMEKLRKWMGEEVIAFAYGLRDIVAENTPKLKEVYERQFGVPFPAEENYFPAKWIVPQQNDELMTALAGFSGAPGASTGFLKPRVQHGHPLDTTKDALQVMLQAMTLSDAWMHTQDIVADLNAYMRDRKFDAAMVTALGKDGYANFKAWVELLKNGGARQVVDMGAAQSWVDRLYGASAMAVLGFRIQTLFRQLGAFFNGLMGAYDISTAEYIGSLVRLRTGKTPMSYSRMLKSDFIRNRKTGHQGTLQGQAMRPSGEMVSSFEAALEMAMLPMEKADAFLTAGGLVPIWNAYYRRAVKAGASDAEATQDAWVRTIECANRASQPIGWVNKTKLAQDRSITSRAVMFMLSEDLNKMGLCMSLWGGGHKRKALRAWVVYGACNALISAMLDALCGDPDDWEKAHWWEYVVSAIYGPLASCPGVGEAVEALGTLLLRGVGNVAGIEELAEAKTHASVGRAFIDVQGTYRACSKLYKMLTDDDEYALADYTKQATRASRPLSVLAGATGTGVGYGLLFLQTLMNPVDFGARVWEAHGGEK